LTYTIINLKGIISVILLEIKSKK